MWKLKQFIPKEPTGLEGRHIDVGNLKIQVQKAIAEGGFSCVYSARDSMNLSKQYALKHMICNDEESLELAMKEINVMNTLKGHPNVVSLLAHTVFDTGRTKEVLLVMEFCEKSLVAVLENRGAGFYEERQALSIFRDACNAVFAMHNQSPPIAHRDLKPENILLGADGAWKLCDFGSTTTNHKRFEKPEEMGVEEDNIRKHTTPAFRSPEMWDLFRRDVLSEKVDIWALGCLLYRICYLKNAFDGESKLQVLNGNYRIPEQPKYSSPVTELIKHMLRSSPEDRPDIMQVWSRVNDLLPPEVQKSVPDRFPGMQAGRKAVSRPQRSPPPPPPTSGGVSSANRGAFWSTQHAKEIALEDDRSFEITFVQSDVNEKPKGISGEKTLDADIQKLKHELKLANAEKAELSSKYEKLSAICRSQRQEIQDLKSALAAKTTPVNSEVGGGSVTWQAFTDDSRPHGEGLKKIPQSVRTSNGNQKKQASEFESWGFGSDAFTVMEGSTLVSRPVIAENNEKLSILSKPSGNQRPTQQPSGWAGF